MILLYCIHTILAILNILGFYLLSAYSCHNYYHLVTKFNLEVKRFILLTQENDDNKFFVVPVAEQGMNRKKNFCPNPLKSLPLITNSSSHTVQPKNIKLILNAEDNKPFCVICNKLNIMVQCSIHLDIYTCIFTYLVTSKVHFYIYYLTYVY